MTSTPGASKALEAAILAIRARQAGAAGAPPAWLQTALSLHRKSAGLDTIAQTLREAGHPRESVDLALAVVCSDMRRLGLFWSRSSIS